jgi:hypothetical protein
MVASVYPAVGYPTPTGMWRTIPAARRPDVVAIFPAVIAGNPDIAPVRRWWAAFDHRRWRPNANDYLRK